MQIPTKFPALVNIEFSNIFVDLLGFEISLVVGF